MSVTWRILLRERGKSLQSLDSAATEAAAAGKEAAVQGFKDEAKPAAEVDSRLRRAFRAVIASHEENRDQERATVRKTCQINGQQQVCSFRVHLPAKKRYRQGTSDFPP